ncbi:MAG: META domain-containing protein [Anaerolineales bacterium]|nr:META domain-containing protein [Anaerolineales bacterium]
MGAQQCTLVPYCLFAGPADDTIPFEHGNNLNVKTDCSAANGVYRIDGEKIQIELGVMTRAECGVDSQLDEFIPF